MPQINYSREALVQHCFDASGGSRERATRVLDRVVSQRLDFLVPFALLPPCRRRFVAARWVTTHVYLYGEHYNDDDSALYFRLLARAALLTPTLVLEPESMWTNDAFVTAFRTQATAVLLRRSLLRQHNFAALRAHPVAGRIMASIEHRVPSEIARYVQLARDLVAAIECGLPPPRIAARFLSDAEQREYARLLADNDTKCDCALALANGEARQQRGHGTWNVHDTHKALKLLRILATNKEDDERGEEYERHMQDETRQRNEQQHDNLELARRIGCWRARKADFAKWQAALSADEWALYLRCETAMRQVLPSGLVTHIPRRHYSDSSRDEMQRSNLAALAARLHLTA